MYVPPVWSVLSSPQSWNKPPTGTVSAVSERGSYLGGWSALLKGSREQVRYARTFILMKKVEKNSLNWIISIHKSVLLSYLLYSSFRLKGLKPINQHWTIHGGHRRCALKMQQYSDTLHLLADINKNWKKEARNTCMLLLPSLFKTCQKPSMFRGKNKLTFNLHHRHLWELTPLELYVKCYHMNK